jgi:carbon-monoxide dehydrogenase large subunit
VKIALTVNGTAITRDVEGRQNLVDFLRYDLGFTGSHIGCEHGVCGACTVRVDGTPIRGCLMLAAQADGCRVETIEGVAESGAIAALQRAFRAENALQCGFCTPGMLLTAQALLERNPDPDPVAIREAIGGNYCRCTGYHAIVQAILGAARSRSAKAPAAAPFLVPVVAAPENGDYIGRSVVRPQTARLVAGRGTYTDDVAVSRLLHAAFVRSPHAHARIAGIDTAEAAALPGVVAVVTGREMAARCEPWVGVLKNYVGMKSAPQYPLAVDKAVWQGEPVVAVVAESRALAEDGCARVRVTWEPLPPVVDAEAALAPGATVIHPELGDNLVLEMRVKSGDVDAAFKAADAVYRETFDTGRHTVVSLEPRVVLADYDPADETLTVYHSGQAPYMLHDILSRHLRIPEHRVRVINKDVGGSFGLKIHTYPDEMATCALAVMLGRAVKFLADRVESFQTDIHSRDHRVTAEVAVKRDGTILGMRLDDLAPVGPFSMYPRSSVVESGQVLRTTPGPYRFRDYDARGRVVFQNKTPMSQYRAVGHPVAALVMEAMVDRVARELGLDPVEVRRRNLLTADMYPYTAPTGLFFEKLSHEESLDAVLDLAGYRALCAERDRLRARGVYRGLGLCVFIDLTVPGAQTYGTGGARISSQDGTTIRLEPTGKLTVLSSVTEQGQGTDTILAQVAAATVGVPIEDVRVVTGDTMVTPYGGGTWGSRGAGIGGEATIQTGKALKENILKVAAVVLEVDALDLDVRGGQIVDARTGESRMPLSELGRVAYFRPDQLPKDFQSELTVTRHYVPRHQPLAYTNGVQLSYVEVDVDTGFVKLLGHWVAEDCGRIINPMLVDEQVRGGVAHGIGDALFEHCVYDEQGQLLTTTMMDYLVPMAVELPDIGVAHVETPTAYSEGGFKGAGEGGVAGAPGAVLNAVNDALSPFKARVTRVPMTPGVILHALGKL